MTIPVNPQRLEMTLEDRLSQDEGWVYMTGMQALVRDLNTVYRAHPALYEIDFDGRGFAWLDWNDRDSSVFSWLVLSRRMPISTCWMSLLRASMRRRNVPLSMF